jgi:hypothetical protein
LTSVENGEKLPTGPFPNDYPVYKPVRWEPKKELSTHAALSLAKNQHFPKYGQYACENPVTESRENTF